MANGKHVDVLHQRPPDGARRSEGPRLVLAVAEKDSVVSDSSGHDGSSRKRLKERPGERGRGP